MICLIVKIKFGDHESKTFGVRNIKYSRNLISENYIKSLSFVYFWFSFLINIYVWYVNRNWFLILELLCFEMTRSLKWYL